MTIDELIEELEYELVMCQKSGKAEFVAGLERAIHILSELKN